MMDTIDISVVIPARDEMQSIRELSQRLVTTLEDQDLSYEVIYIDDGSIDETWSEIITMREKNHSFKGIRFNRNYGKAAALQTGFRMSKGEVVITMDADLQDRPEEIPGLYKMIVEDGNHLVSGWKKKRRDPLSKTIPSKFFNAVTRIVSGIPLHDFNCGLKAYKKVVIKHITLYGEMHRYTPLLAKWSGFTRIEEKPVDHAERKYGHTKFGMSRFLIGFLDLLSVMFISKFRRKPMHFFGSIGVFFFFIGSVFTIHLLYNKIYSLFISKLPLERSITDQPIFYFALTAIILGVQFFLSGYLGEMFAIQSLAKREYIILERAGFSEND